MSIKLYRSTIEDRVAKLAANYNGDSHEAFLRLIFCLVTGKGYDDLEPEDIVDGSGEYQIDVLHLDDSSAENQAVVTLILQACVRLKRTTIQTFSEGEVNRTVLANGVFHVARAVAFLWRGSDDWNDLHRTQRDLQRLQDEPDVLEPHFKRALNLVVKTLEANQQFAKDVTTGLKSGRLDEELDKSLYLVSAQSSAKLPRTRAKTAKN
ncbi:MAG TPA: hypothetical protein PKA41_02325 [Verrucomicrobiota bacterium]|nr:hypothetical protein [Verrucomicrobiota bacterium]